MKIELQYRPRFLRQHRHQQRNHGLWNKTKHHRLLKRLRHLFISCRSVLTNVTAVLQQAVGTNFRSSPNPEWVVAILRFVVARVGTRMYRDMLTDHSASTNTYAPIPISSVNGSIIRLSQDLCSFTEDWRSKTNGCVQYQVPTN